MTNFSVQAIPYSSSISPLFSEEKGTMGNRVDCAAAQTWNTTKGVLKTGMAGGAAYGAYALAKKYPAVEKFMTGGLKMISNLMTKNKYTNKVAEFITKGISNLSKAGKIGAIAAIIATPVIAYVGAKQMYQMGQIDQKYTDRAGMQRVV